jgi:prophage regulatory protein
MNTDIKPVYLDLPSVAVFVALSETTVQKLVREKTFPQPRMISAHRVAWLTHEVEAWAQARPVSALLPPPNAGARKARQ